MLYLHYELYHNGQKSKVVLKKTLYSFLLIFATVSIEKTTFYDILYNIIS